MKNKDLFDKTIDILVKAYQNNTLMHLNCAACAVGNIIAYNKGYKLLKDNTSNIDWCYNNKLLAPNWGLLFQTSNGRQYIYQGMINDAEIFEEIKSTGYSWQDLAKIEFAFETAPKGNSDDEWMFNGLMAVCDVLLEIHEAEKEFNSVKELFVKT